MRINVNFFFLSLFPIFVYGVLFFEQSFSSLGSLASCCSLDSLKETTPFRIPPWDRSSTEACFAKSHAILTKHHPTLYSVKENDRSECRSRFSLSEDDAKFSTLNQYLKQNVSQLSNSIEFACDSEYELSRMSEISKDGMSVSSYDWVFKSPKPVSTASSETLIDENSLSERDTRGVVMSSEKVVRRTSASFPNSPRKYVKKNRSCKSTPMRRLKYQCSSSDSEYETAPCRSSGSYHSGSSRGSTFKYTMPRGSSSSDEEFAQIMKAFMK